MSIGSERVTRFETHFGVAGTYGPSPLCGVTVFRSPKDLTSITVRVTCEDCKVKMGSAPAAPVVLSEANREVLVRLLGLGVSAGELTSMTGAERAVELKRLATVPVI